MPTLSKNTGFIPTGHLMGVILAGGDDTRLWPLSRSKKPKHLLPLLGNTTLLRQVYDRLRKKIPAKDILVVTAKDLVAVSRKELPGIPPGNILDEPCRRGTAAAIAWGATVATKRYHNAMIVVATADAWINDTSAFHADVEIAARVLLANPHHIVMLGVPPTRPETGYGYILAGDLIAKDTVSKKSILTVNHYVEKPDAASAQQYLKSGKYYWNSGIYVGFARHIADTIGKHVPGYAAAFAAKNPALKYGRLAETSIDYAVWEKEPRLLILPVSFQWDDVGSWKAAQQLSSHDALQNVVTGATAVALAGAVRNMVIGEKGKVIAIVGLSDIAVIDTKDALLICPLVQSAAVKDVVSLLKKTSKLKKYV